MPAQKKKKNPGGRPSKYTAEFLEKEADLFIKWIKESSNVFFKKFALERGYSPQRFTDFAEKNERFREAYELAKSWQEAKLVEGGLLRTYDSGFTKWVMANTCGWKEKQEITGNAINPLSVLLSKVDGTSKDLVQKDE